MPVQSHSDQFLGFIPLGEDGVTGWINAFPLGFGLGYEKADAHRPVGVVHDARTSAINLITGYWWIVIARMAIVSIRWRDNNKSQ